MSSDGSSNKNNEDEWDKTKLKQNKKRKCNSPKQTKSTQPIPTSNKFHLLSDIADDLNQQFTPEETISGMEVETYNEHGMVNIRSYLDANLARKRKQDEFPVLKVPNKTVTSRTFHRTQIQPAAKKVDHYEDKDGMRLPVLVNDPEPPSQSNNAEQPPNNSGRVPPITIIDTHMYKVVKDALKQNDIIPKFISNKDGLKMF